jgi:hypothetical protein
MPKAATLKPKPRPLAPAPSKQTIVNNAKPKPIRKAGGVKNKTTAL